MIFFICKHCNQLYIFLVTSFLIIYSFYPPTLLVSAQYINVDDSDSDLDSDSIWNPLYTGIVATFLTMFFIIFYYTAYACFIQFCWLPPEPEPPQRPPGGLDKAILEACPVFTYSNVASLESHKEILECAVCLSLFEEEDTLRLLSKCNHVFHLHCVDDWLAAHTTCPLCRANLVSIHDEMMIRVESGNVDESGSMLGAEVGIDTLQKIEEIHEDQYISNNIWKCNSTGHLTEIERDGDEDGERFRLRLPEAIREDFLRSSLTRSSSCIITLWT